MAEKRTPTPEQQRVIDMTNRTVLLSAAAGSGKTATLTERLILMITREEEPLDVTRMLVVTFTRAAAEELRVRISEALAAAVAEHPEDRRLSRQMLLLPTARIRTIDAFCNDLVKGHTDSLGISPLYRIADETEIDLFGISLLDEVIEDAYNGTYAPEGLDIATVVEIAETVKGSGTLAPMLYKLYKTRLHGIKEGVLRLSEGADKLEKEASLPFFETRAGRALATHYKETALNARALLLASGDSVLSRFGKDDPIFQTLSPRYFYLLLMAERIADACDTSYDALGALALEYALPKVPNCPRGYEYAKEEALFKTLIGDTDKMLKSIFEALAWKNEDLAYAFSASARVSRSLYLLFAEFEARFFAEKKRRAICDHSDITNYAYNLLLKADGTPTPLALEMRDAFDAVCIDEYQDVNETQHRIFEAISTERNRFMVGDIKQSIYAFRGAVPDIFGRLRASLPSADEEGDSAVLYLTRNFRSEEPVISFANGVFDFLFPIIGDAIGYVEEDRLYTEKEKGAVPVPTFYLMEKESKKKSASDEEADDLRLPTEDELVAKKVRALLAHGRKKDGTPLRPSDIAILTREYPYELIETLKAYGIPLKTRDKTDFFSHSEILLALSLCHAVNNPHRDIYLGGLLRSPLYGFTLDDLVSLRLDAPNGSLYDALLLRAEQHPEDEKTQRILSDLARFRKMAENAPSHRLIREMFNATGIYAVTDAAGRANLRAFYELARAFEASAFRGLYRFLDRVAEMRAHGKGIPEHDTGEEEAVTVSTIHASKGLEYPVCILAHTGKELKKADAGAFLFSEALGLVSPVPSESGNALLTSPLLSAHDVLKKRGEMEEAVRVLYVALTRPKEQLFVFCSTQRKLTESLLSEVERLHLSPSVPALHAYASYAVWMLAALKDNPALFRLVTLPPPYLLEDGEEEAPAKEDAEEVKERASALSQEEIDAFKEEYRLRFSYTYPHEKETRLPAKLSVSALYPGVLDELTARSPFDAPPSDVKAEEEPTAKEEKDFTPTLPAFLRDREENDAAKAGTATHLFLQFCDFDRILTTDSCHLETIKEELARLSSRGFLTESDASRVRCDELARFLTSDLRDAITEAKETFREFRFHAMLPAKDFSLAEKEQFDGLSVFAQGVIDLLLVRADGSLLLVDYKTDRIKRGASDEEAKALLFGRHATQLTVYARAVERIFGKTPDVAIYSLPLAKLLYLPQ